MTGSGSKGNGGIYHYYHCQRVYGCKNSIPSQIANLKFTEYLSTFKPEAEEVELYRALLESEFNNNGVERESEKVRLKNEINRLEGCLQTAAMKNIQGVLDDDRYCKIKMELNNKKNELIVRLDNLNALPPEFSTYMRNSISLVSDLNKFYITSTSDVQKKLAGSIITGELYFENNSYRTTKINDAIEIMHSMGKGFNKNCLAINTKQSSLAPTAGLEPATL